MEGTNWQRDTAPALPALCALRGHGDSGTMPWHQRGHNPALCALRARGYIVMGTLWRDTPEGTWGHCKGSLGRAGQCPGTICSLCPEGTRGQCHGDTQAVGHCPGTTHSSGPEGMQGIVLWVGDTWGHMDTVLAPVGTPPTLHALTGHGDTWRVGHPSGGHMGQGTWCHHARRHRERAIGRTW